MMDKAFKTVLSAALACCGFAFTAQADSISALGGDVTYAGGYRGAERVLYSSDGLIYYTDDHYESFTPLYEFED